MQKPEEISSETMSASSASSSASSNNSNCNSNCNNNSNSNSNTSYSMDRASQGSAATPATGLRSALEKEAWALLKSGKFDAAAGAFAALLATGGPSAVYLAAKR